MINVYMRDGFIDDGFIVYNQYTNMNCDTFFDFNIQGDTVTSIDFLKH